VITAHGADAISEYNEVYTSLICNVLNWELGTASLLTDGVRSLMLSRGFDSTKDDKIITEFRKQLEFLARFLV
jgi:hypothetical protein